jgi:glycosyltransferase involved in cell wall biosynthesis
MDQPAPTQERELELTVLMPCLNEAETLGRCIEKAQRFLERSGVSGEVLIADNGSTDGSPQIAEKLGARLVRVSDRGYGAALYEGSQAARGHYIVMGDADDSYDFSKLDPFIEKLRQGCDLVMGNRFAGGISPGAMPWKNRVLGNPVLSGLGRLLFRTPIRDFHCGLRGYSRKAYEQMDLRTAGMEFASEMVIKATLLGMKVVEVPTKLHKDGRSRAPHLRPWRDGWRHLRFMMLYSPRWLFLYPGVMMMVGGAALGAWVLPETRVIGSVGFDVHTLLYAAMAVLVGFQAVAFSAFSRVFAVVEGLKPSTSTYDRMFTAFTLETGLVIGTFLVLAGVGGTIYAVGDWAGGSFGALDPRRTLRVAIPSVLALTLGCEVILASFFLSMLGLRTLRRGARSP